MKVLFLSIVPSPYQRDFFAALAAQPDVDIVVRYAEAGSPDSPWPKEALRPYEGVYRSFYLSWKGKRFIVNWQLPSLKGIDAVVLNGYVTVPAQWVLRFNRRKIPLIFWAERMESPAGGMRARLQRFLIRPLNRLSAVVAIGKKAARDYRRRFPGIPVHEVPYYCSLEEFQKEIPERPRRPVTLLFCGQMIARKGVDLLLEAFSTLIGEGLDIRLLLVGREDEMSARLDSLPAEVRERIEYAGFQAPAALPGFFARADVFVLPSRYDGWGVVVNQALGAGLPVVCSDAVGSAEDLARPGWNGFIFPSGDAGTLTDCLRELTGTEGLIRRFAENSQQLGRQITPETGARDWCRILRETIEG